jgi:N-formylglutamate amidohydrolase
LAPNDVAGPLSSPPRNRERSCWSIAAPAVQTVPLVFASPHSGRDYPADLIDASKLGALALRRSEDAFVDQIFSAAPAHGAPLLKAHFPRVFVDPNREPFELDPAMFAGPLPDFVTTSSPRITAGLGTIARVIATGEEIYRDKLNIAAALARIEAYYFPYHDALKSLIRQTLGQFGVCLLIDCHSMPSIGGPMDSDPGTRRVDMVLGDCFGSSCAPVVTDLAERTLFGLGFSVRRNVPYAGGFTTRHYGRPRSGVHALQIEVNRSLYMNEEQITPLAAMGKLIAGIGRLIQSLAGIDGKILRPR